MLLDMQLNKVELDKIINIFDIDKECILNYNKIILSYQFYFGMYRRHVIELHVQLDIKDESTYAYLILKYSDKIIWTKQTS